MPTIYSEGYSAIWEMWAKVTIHKRLLAPLVVALAASVLLLGWAAGSPAAAPGRADPDETGVSDSVQAQVVRAPVQLTDNVGVSEGVYFGSFNGGPFIEADVAISEVVQLSVSRAPVQLTDTIQLIDGPFITPLPGPVVVVIDSGHVAESVDFSVVRAASPSLQFSAATYSVAENSGSATIIVTRTGDSAGEATVGYAPATAPPRPAPTTGLPPGISPSPTGTRPTRPSPSPSSMIPW